MGKPKYTQTLAKLYCIHCAIPYLQHLIQMAKLLQVTINSRRQFQPRDSKSNNFEKPTFQAELLFLRLLKRKINKINQQQHWISLQALEVRTLAMQPLDTRALAITHLLPYAAPRYAALRYAAPRPAVRPLDTRPLVMRLLAMRHGI
jgi:hypothetical protein